MAEFAAVRFIVVTEVDAERAGAGTRGPAGWTAAAAADWRSDWQLALGGSSVWVRIGTWEHASPSGGASALARAQVSAMDAIAELEAFSVDRRGGYLLAEVRVEGYAQGGRLAPALLAAVSRAGLVVRFRFSATG